MEYGGVVFSAISSEVSLFVMFVPAVFTIGVAFLVAFFPAIKSARAVPIEAMRRIKKGGTEALKALRH